MQKLVAFSVKNPVAVLMAALAVLLLGALSYKRLGMELFPTLNNPRLYIALTAGERPPEEIEKQYVQKLEALAVRQRGASGVYSTCAVGMGHITVEYAWNTDMNEALLDLQKAVTAFAQTSDMDAVDVTHYDPNDEPVMILAFSNRKIDDMNAMRKTAETCVRTEIIRQPGIADVEICGQDQDEVEIKTNDYLLQAYGLSAAAIATQIQNFNRNVSGGSITELGLKYVVKGTGVFNSLADFEDLVVGFSQNAVPSTGQDTSAAAKTPIRLKDVATVALCNKDPQNIARINGVRCIGLRVYKESRFNTITAVNEIVHEIEHLRATLPGYEFTIVANQGKFIDESIGEMKQAALVGIFLAILVLLFFLRQLGPTVIIGVAIPFSIVATFNLMYFRGLTLNLMTLGGLALAAGRLVDDAVVVVENIIRNFESGIPIREAAVKGTAQVGTAVLASTITTVVVFLPIVYMHGISAELFRDQAWTVTFALFSSLVVALSLIPMLASRFLGKRQLHRSLRFAWYRDLLEKALSRRRTVLVCATALMAGSAAMIPFVGTEFFPAVGSRQFTVAVHLPEGTSLQRTAQTVSGIENLIKSVLGDAVQTVYSESGPVVTTSIATSNNQPQDENTAEIRVVLDPRRTMDAARAAALLSKSGIAGVGVTIQYKPEQNVLQNVLGRGEPPVVVQVKGDDLDILEKAADSIAVALRKVPGLANVSSNFEQGAPSIEIVVDRLRAGDYNASAADIATQLSDELLGRNAGQWNRNGELKDITVKFPAMTRPQLSRFMLVEAGSSVPLQDVAQVKQGFSPKEILRHDQTRLARITAGLAGGAAFSNVMQRVRQRLGAMELPPGCRLEISGDEQKRAESFQGLVAALALAILLVYMVLAAQLESLVHPFVIICTVPLAVIGVVPLFFILGKSFNIMALIGVIMLVGIVVSNAIVLLDAIRQLRLEGVSRREAILAAGERRFRPIVITSLTTILALLPLAFGFGEGAALRTPMALAVMGGLAASTLLTLVVIPCVYDVVDEIVQGTRRKK
ncbi:MAG TPA: efflux RND transporter permease subunit [Chitinivibrionales bacterium]|nr:efflux RND transporter permease subunit [Chitinivibrionales bacterium]